MFLWASILMFWALSVRSSGRGCDPKGRMDLELYLQGRLEKDWASTLKGRGNLKLDPVSAEGLPLAQRLGINTLVAEINGVQHRAEDLTLRITNPFTIQSRRVSSPALRVEVGPIPLKFEGWTDFDGRLDYVIRTDVIRDQLPVGMRGVLDDLKPQEEAAGNSRTAGCTDHSGQRPANHNGRLPDSQVGSA